MCVLGRQDISGGQPVQLEGTDLPVWGMEIDPDKAKQQFRSYSATDKGSKVGNALFKGQALCYIAMLDELSIFLYITEYIIV